MNSKLTIVRTRLCLALIVCLASLWLFLGRIQAADDWVLAANVTAGVTRLSSHQARSVMAGRTPWWANGEQVVLVLPPRGSPASQWLCDHLLQTPERIYRRFLLEQVYRGGVRTPFEARNNAEAAQLVASVRGAISALPRALVGPNTAVIDVVP